MKKINESDLKNITGGKCTAPKAILYGIAVGALGANPASVGWGVVSALGMCEWNNMDVASQYGFISNYIIATNCYFSYFWIKNL